jgi:drug/metabolite transporter (DMT)-like permease
MKIFVWLLLCLIWGTTWFFIKIGLEDLPPISFAALRFICALVIVFIIISIQKIQLPKTKSDWKLVGITGFLQFSFNYAAVFWS